MNLYIFEKRCYTPLKPQQDSNELAEAGDRLVLKHIVGQNPKLFVAEKGTPVAGWVIGRF